MDEHGPLSRAHVRHRLPQRSVTGQKVRAVAAEYPQPGDALDDVGDVAAGRLHIDRNGYRVAVVLDEVEHRHLTGARRVDRFPELAFAGRAFADRHVGDLVGMIRRLPLGYLFHARVNHARLGTADRVETLRARAAAL